MRDELESWRAGGAFVRSVASGLLESVIIEAGSWSPCSEIDMRSGECTGEGYHCSDRERADLFMSVGCVWKERG